MALPCWGYSQDRLRQFSHTKRPQLEMAILSFEPGNLLAQSPQLEMAILSFEPGNLLAQKCSTAYDHGSIQ